MIVWAYQRIHCIHGIVFFVSAPAALGL
jgi:hypothetical protein